MSHHDIIGGPPSHVLVVRIWPRRPHQAGLCMFGLVLVVGARQRFSY